MHRTTNRRYCRTLWWGFALSLVCFAGPATAQRSLNDGPAFTRLRSAFQHYTVVLEPEFNRAEWWAGAPSVCRAEDGTFYLAARMREAKSRRGLRGYEIRILESPDGKNFKLIKRIPREDVPMPGFERPALVIDPNTKKFRLYGCGPLKSGWGIIKWDDADHPSRIDVTSAKPVLQAAPVEYVGSEPSGENMNDKLLHSLLASVTGYKDPFIMYLEGQWHMFVIAIYRVERLYHLVSDDGIHWTGDPNNPLLDSAGWHNFYTRPACVVPTGAGYLFVYEGSNTSWRDPVYNIATGLGYTLDLSHVTDLTPEAPLLTTTTPGKEITLRYSHWLRVGSKIYAYYEAERANNSHEVRLTILDADDFSR